MKLWEKGVPTSESVERFTAGNDRTLDLSLALADVQGSMAHARMLETIGLLTHDELKQLSQTLQGILSEIQAGKFVIEAGVEDVHSQIELMLTRSLGDTGKRIHAGRSRNDQVLVDLKLYFRSALREIMESSASLAKDMLGLSEQYKGLYLPGYTHFQVAMPSSFGLWFGAYAESLADDLDVLEAAFRLSNRNPLGSAAGYGTSLPVNRRHTTELLGFAGLHHNVVYAQMSRGKTEKLVAQSLAAVGSTLGKMAADICLYMSQDLGFLSLADEFTTGSSIMPHKKNPDAFELIRARANLLQGIPNQIALLTGNLPSGYHRDFQLLKEILFPAFELLSSSLEMMTLLLPHLRPRDRILEVPKYDYLFSVDSVNRLLGQGVPFREAYQQIGRQISEGLYLPERNMQHTHEGSMGNLQTFEIGQMIDSKMDLYKREYFEPIDRAIGNLFVV